MVAVGARTVTYNMVLFFYNGNHGHSLQCNTVDLFKMHLSTV